MGVISKTYIFSFNCFSLLAWVCIAHFCIQHLLDHGIKDFDIFYNKVEKPLQIAQSLAILEVVHAGMNLVRSGWITNVIQVVSRLHVVWIIFVENPATHNFIYMFTCIFAWSIAEIIRYPFYALGVFDISPKFLTILRYSGFLVLYPIGIFSEVRCILHSLPLFRDNSKFSTWPSAMPNVFNFQMNLYVVYLVILACYIPGSFVMFTHMLGQRKKVMKKLNASKVKAE